MIRSLRDEALLILEGRGAILDIARDVTYVLREADLEGAVVGGVAVVLHGYVRTTIDVDIFVDSPLPPFSEALKAAGYSWDRRQAEFHKRGVPVHLVTSEQVRIPPRKIMEIDDIRTVGLADLINMKLDSGLRDPLRAIDLADVIGLIRCHSLSPTFAAKIEKPLRLEFRKFARAVAKSQ